MKINHTTLRGWQSWWLSRVILDGRRRSTRRTTTQRRSSNRRPSTPSPQVDINPHNHGVDIQLLVGRCVLGVLNIRLECLITEMNPPIHEIRLWYFMVLELDKFCTIAIFNSPLHESWWMLILSSTLPKSKCSGVFTYGLIFLIASIVTMAFSACLVHGTRTVRFVLHLMHYVCKPIFPTQTFLSFVF